MNEAFDDYHGPEEFIDAGDDQVLVFSAREGAARAAAPRLRGSPTPTSGRSATARPSRMQSYWERADALKAVGLAE